MEIHWADLAAQKLIEKEDKKEYVCASGITPSGTVHIGNFREVITTDIVSQALKKLGKKVKFIYSWDDYDTFRKVPANMPNQDELKKYMRKPIIDAPDPFGCHKSYAEHNEKEFEKELSEVYINPKFLYQSQKYRKCEYADLIKIAMQKRRKIAEILNKYREEPLEQNWYPVTIFCSKCNTDKTKIKVYDEDCKVTYSCECNHEETFDIRKKGIIKLLWRIDWPMRWKYESVDFEPGGKDHSTAGGSYTTGCEIIREIYASEPPQYVMYDFIGIKGLGGKISSSKGNVITLKDVLKIYEPEVVRWIFASTRPNTEFSISFDADVITMYEEFDKGERLYFGKEELKISEDQKEKEKRMYELSVIEPQKDLPIQPGFRHIATIAQIHELNAKKTIEHFKDLIKRDFDKKRLETRTECVINWLTKHAPEEFKFSINKTAPKLQLNDKEKLAVSQIIKVLGKKDLIDEDLHHEFYEVMKSTGLNIKEFFGLFYRILIGKEKGPKLASFILIIGQDKVKKLLENMEEK